MNSENIGIITTAISILIGIIVSYYFYKKGLRGKKLSWACLSNNMISGYKTKVDGLQVLFNEIIIENLTISKILLWNEGVDTIDRDDIETINRLRIVSNKDQVRFLDAKILVQNNQSSQCEVMISDKGDCMYIGFDYLDPKQGCVIQLIHTGLSSKDIRLTGDVKGLNKILDKGQMPLWVNLVNFPKKLASRNLKSGTYFIIVSGLGFILLGIALFIGYLRGYFVELLSNLEHLPLTYSIASIFFGIITLYMGIFYYKKLAMAPQGLDIFMKENLEQKSFPE